MISMPLLLSEKYSPKSQLQVEDEAAEISQRTEEFTMAKNLLSSGADAVERIMTSYKELTELTGFTRRVYEMFRLFETESHNSDTPIEIDSKLKPKDQIKENGPIKSGHVFESENLKSITVEDISVVTPNGDVIVPSLSLKIEHGMNLLITGPNGCGKSSLFRILSGLWPLKNGTVHRPKLKDMFYVPQRPYLAIGTLRDQIIYPDRVEDMIQKGLTDADLMNIMEIVNLANVVSREGGLDAVSDWKDVLSGGEKQRLGLSRIFYHR